ncbi:unnamed protein product [Macrosiphum euphorbiae]|uniref:Uncharacterized protein n=1 Tax=Macrosiphum euphorbiae TaxID=13131 RepID=A0AAV0VNM7_9HEMI|nr:unnamed protein product [Macrosiphum euphorbiae]
MLASDFYKIINSENSRVEFLQNHGLLPKEHEINNCEKYGVATKICLRKKRLASGETREYKFIRCVVKGCQTFKSIGSNNLFFKYTDLHSRCHSNLSLGQI